MLLENLRFHAEEEKNDPAFATALATLADVYVNDAFGAAHREHASVVGMVGPFAAAGAGLLMEKELTYLGMALGDPERPFVAIIGGAKVSDKIEVIENLLTRVDHLLVGGAMAYTFFKALGLPVGRSLVEDDKLAEALKIIEAAKTRGVELTLPVDHVVADRMDAGAATAVLQVSDHELGDRMGLDIGPETTALFGSIIATAKTVVWNGPMGVFEMAPFAAGTMAVAKAVAAVRRHDHHRRRRFGGGRTCGRRSRPDQPHLHRRRRVAGVPGRRRASRSGGPPGQALVGRPERPQPCANRSSRATGRCSRPCTRRWCT